MIGCSKVEVFILTLKWRKKPLLPRKKVCDSTNPPYTYGRWFISDNNGVSNSEFSPWAEPFLALLQQRKVFSFPATPKNICQILNLSPSSPRISVVFLLTALAVEIDFGELHILGHSPPTQAQMMIGNWAPLPNGHCGWTQCNSWWSFISRIGFSVIMHFQWGGLDSYGDTVGNIHGENASTHSQCCVSLSYSPCKRGLYRSVTLTSSSRFF